MNLEQVALTVTPEGVRSIEVLADERLAAPLARLRAHDLIRERSESVDSLRLLHQLTTPGSWHSPRIIRA